MVRFLNGHLSVILPAISLFFIISVPAYFFRSGYAQSPEQFQADKLVTAGYNTRYVFIGNVKDFLDRLKKIKTLQTFMQTPWGKDIVSSAPLSSFSSVQAALQLFPESFQFDAVSLLMPGSLYYASGSGGYVLFFETNNAGKTLVENSQLRDKRVAYTHGYIVFASSTVLLNAQTEAIKNQKKNTEISGDIIHPGSLSIFIPERPYVTGKKNEEPDLFFATLNTFFPEKYISTKRAFVTPEPSGIKLDANFEFNKSKADEIWYFYQNGKADLKHTGSLEKVAFGIEVSQDSANIRMFSDEGRSLLPVKGEKTSSAVLLNGINYDYGILLPEVALLFNKTDTSVNSFLSQAFKFNKYKESAVPGGLKFTFENPYQYYSDKKNYIFEPHLVSQGNYNIWTSTSQVLKSVSETATPEMNAYTALDKPEADEFIFALFAADPHAFAVSAQKAIKNFEGVYSPQYLADFKEALGKSVSFLKKSRLRGVSVIGKKHLRVKANLLL